MENSSIPNRHRYTVNDIANNRFYQMPKFLFEGELKKLSNDARVLYSLLKDRHELSVMNNWFNEKQEVYLIYTRKNMEEMLGVSDKTVKKAVDSLVQYGLLEEERMGLSKANRIYLTSATVDNSRIGESPIQESEILRFKSRNNSDSRSGEFTIQETDNFRPNDTNNINTDFNDPEYQSINPETGLKMIDEIENSNVNSVEYEIIKKYREAIADNIEYLHLKANAYRNDPIIDNIFEIIVDAVTTKKAFLRVSGEDKPSDLVKAVLLKLNSAHVEYVISCMRKNTTKISNIESYLLTALYKAPKTMEMYYTNQASHDMANY